MLREPIGDLCISRPKTPPHLGHRAAVRRPLRHLRLVRRAPQLRERARAPSAGSDLWPHAQHLIGKDILKPHAVFWPTMLMAAGLPLYRRLCTCTATGRCSQARCRRASATSSARSTMKTRYGMDAFRYFLLREMAFGQDAEFSEDALVTRLNADLANNLGNLASRMLAMQQRYFEGAVQPLDPSAARPGAARGVRRRRAASSMRTSSSSPSIAALEAVWRAIDHANKYVVETAPFTLAKDPAQRPRVGAILHELCEALRVTAQLLDAVPARDVGAARRAARLPGNAAGRARPAMGHGLRSGSRDERLPRRSSHASSCRPTDPCSSTRTATWRSRSSTPTATRCWRAPPRPG